LTSNLIFSPQATFLSSGFDQNRYAMPATKEWHRTSQILQTKEQNHCSEGPGNMQRVDNIIIIKIDDKPSTTL